MILEHYGDCDICRAVRRLRKVQQRGSVKNHLARFDIAVAECVCIKPEDKLKYFVEGPSPEIQTFVYVCRLGNMSE